MKNIKISKNLKAMIIRITLLILFILILGKICYSQAYHQTVYSNIDGTTYVTHINGYGSTVNVSTYEVSRNPSTGLDKSTREMLEESQRRFEQRMNEDKMCEKWERGEITYEEYCAAVPQEFRVVEGEGSWSLSEALHRLNVERLAEGKEVVTDIFVALKMKEYSDHHRAVTKELEEAGIR